MPVTESKIMKQPLIAKITKPALLATTALLLGGAALETQEAHAAEAPFYLILENGASETNTLNIQDSDPFFPTVLVFGNNATFINDGELFKNLSNGPFTFAPAVVFDETIGGTFINNGVVSVTPGVFTGGVGDGVDFFGPEFEIFVDSTPDEIALLENNITTLLGGGSLPNYTVENNGVIDVNFDGVYAEDVPGNVIITNGPEAGILGDNTAISVFTQFGSTSISNAGLLAGSQAIVITHEVSLESSENSLTALAASGEFADLGLTLEGLQSIGLFDDREVNIVNAEGGEIFSGFTAAIEIDLIYEEFDPSNDIHALLGTDLPAVNVNIVNEAGASIAGVDAAIAISGEGFFTLSDTGDIITAPGSVNVQNDGTIAATGFFSTAILIDSLPNVTITNTGLAGAIGDFGAAIALSNTTGAVIDNSGELVVEGFGGIAVFASQVEGLTIENSGLIGTSTGAGSIAVAVVDAADSFVINSGSIGTVDADSFGVFFNVAENLTLENSGVIVTEGAGSHGVLLSTDTSLSTVTNSGQITVSGADAAGVWIEGDLNSLTNSADASVSATGLDGIGVIFASTTGQVNTVYNHGEIDGTLFAIAGLDGSDSVFNYGVIGNHINLGDGHNDVHNFGVIEGNVIFGTGNDTFTIGFGSTVNGTVDGGEGGDNLQFHVAEGEVAVVEASTFDPFLSFELFQVVGGGTFSFADSSPFGTVAVTEGLFNVNQTFTGDISVNPAGRLGGSGTIIGNVFNSGIINPGNSPGTLTVDGDVTFAMGSTFEVEFTVDTADLLLVSGVTTIEDDVTLLLTPDGDNVFGIFTHEVLRSDGGIVGDFTTVAAPNFAIVDTYYEGNSLFVDIVTQLGVGVALGPQSTVVADYLNRRLVSGAAPETLDVFTSLVALDATTQLNGALNQLHPEAYAGTSSLSATAALSVVDALRDQLVVGRDAEKGHIDLWVSGLGDFVDQDGQSGAGTSGFDIDSYGVVAGLSYGLSDAITVGALVGYQNLEQDFDSLSVESDVDNVFFGAYVSAGIQKFNADAAFIYHTADVDTTRSISALNETAFGDYDLDAYTLSGRLGYEAFANKGWLIEPYVGATYINSERDDVREVGANGASLFVQGEETDFAFLDLGTRVVGQWSEGRIEPYVDLAWRYDLSDDPNGATARFNNESAAFRVQGADVERSRAHIGAGLTGHITSKLKAYATYGGDFGSDISSHSFRTGVRYSF